MAGVSTIPGPKGYPLIGNLLEMGSDPLDFFTRCARDYGDFVQCKLGRDRFYLLNNPAYIEYVLVTNHRNFIKSKDYRQEDMRLLFGQGLLTSDGEFWLRQRRLSQPAFHRDRIIRYAAMMVAYTQQMLGTWHDGETRDIHQDMTRVTLDVVARTLFDTDITDKAAAVGKAMRGLGEELANDYGVLGYLIPFSVPTPRHLRFRRAVSDLDNIVYTIIRQHRNNDEDNGDLLTMLLAARDEDGSQLSDQQVRDEVMTLFLAGHETTALALSWTWYLLAQHPEVEAKLVAELQAVLAGREPTAADLPRLHYSEQIINESLRLYPPAWLIGRQVEKECEIGGHHLAAGDNLVLCQWTMHRDPRYYDDPERFNPERWTDEMKGNLPKYAYFPFGGGPRLCIGLQFARMEATLMLATIAQQFHFDLAPTNKIAMLPSITLRPRHGVKVTLQRRH